MSEVKHTPGPWKVAGRGDGTGDLPIKANGSIIAAIRDNGRLADARLIAAAPELLAALNRIIAINGSTGGAQSLVNEFKHIARTAIAKATT